MKKIGIVILSLLITVATASAAGRYEVLSKSATTVVSTSSGGNIGLFTKIDKSSDVDFDAYTLRIRNPEYRNLDLLVSEIGSGPGPGGYDTNYAGQTWQSPIKLKDRNNGVNVNVTITVSDLVVEATFYQLKDY